MENKTFVADDAGLVRLVGAQPERVVLMVSPCRSGSTAMLRVFGYSGYTAVFQPIKNALRWQNLETSAPWEMPAVRSVFIKETFGPYHQFEVLFDPVQVLLEAGVDPARLRLVVLLREPADVWASWQAVWGGLARISMLEQAYAACEAAVASARVAGVGLDTLSFEACCADPRREVGRLFDAMGQTLTDHAVAHWDALPRFAQDGSGVVIPQEPERYVVPHAHAAAVQSAAYGQVRRVQASARDQAAIRDTVIPVRHANLSGLTAKERA